MRLGLRRGCWRWPTGRAVATGLLAVVAIGCGPVDELEPDGERSVTPIAAAASGASGFVVDDVGDTLRTEAPRTRVVSMIPSVTELLIALGRTDRLVGRTRYDTDQLLSALPSVGGGLDPDMESLVALRPDLVVLWPDHDMRGVGARLQELGVPTYGARIEGLADFRRHAAAIGDLINLRSAADSLVHALDEDLARVRAAVSGRDRPTVAYVISLNPPMVAGPGTFVDSLIAVAGGRNAFPDLTAPWPQISLEEVVRRDPDYVAFSVADQDALALVRTAVGWERVAAVREERLAAFDPDRFNRPGPGIADAAAELARWLHPDAFEPLRRQR